MTWLDLIRPFRGRIWLLGCCTALGAIVSLFFVLSPIPTSFSVTDIFYVRATEDVENSEQVPSNADADKVITDLLNLFKQTSFQRELLLSEAADDELRAKSNIEISATNESNTRLLTVTLEGSDYSEVSKAASRLDAAISGITNKLFKDIEVVNVGSSESYSEGTQSVRLSYFGLGIAAGFLVGIALSYLLALLRPKIWDSVQLETLGCPFLGTFIEVK